MIYYAFDLYPRLDPVGGVRHRRFSEPGWQEAEYRATANGTGSGKIVIRSTTSDAFDVDPLGLQYIRVLRVNPDVVDGGTLSGFDELVVGGFFLESGQFAALSEHSTKKLTFAGAGALSYLDRATVADETHMAGVATSESWKVAATGTPPAGWHTVGFDDSSYANAVHVNDVRWIEGGSPRWIWEDAGDQGAAEERSFRKEFGLSQIPAFPYLLFAADNGGEVRINGTLVASLSAAERGGVDLFPWTFAELARFEIDPSLLVVGTNCISVIGWNATNPSGPGPAAVYAVLTDPDLPPPEQGTWDLPDQTIGSILWRMVSEALSPNRPQQPIPGVTLTFSETLDSDGNPWVDTYSSPFQVGDSLLDVVHRLMEAGLYVSMDPDTFALSAWMAVDHGRDRTGGAWATDVVRFQSPTSATVPTGNIKSDATRGLKALIKRSDLLVGGTDSWTWVHDPGADIVWEGGYRIADPAGASLADIGAAQLAARSDAGDTVRLRMVLGDNEAAGHYLPFEHVQLDDHVTLHNGAGTWDWNEAEMPVAAITLQLREGGDWDVFVDLGSPFSDISDRTFQVAGGCTCLRLAVDGRVCEQFVGEGGG